MKEVIVTIDNVELKFEVPNEVTQDQLDFVVGQALEGIGGRPKDRG